MQSGDSRLARARGAGTTVRERARTQAALGALLLLTPAPAAQDPGEVIRGQNDWLYISGAGHSQRCFEGRARVDEEVLELWCTILESRRLWCEARGLRYALLIAPDKHQIYPEHVPEDWERAEGDTCLDRLYSALEGRAAVQPIDMRVPLRAAREEHLVYFQYGSHWNDRGGFLAYQALAERLGLEAWPRSDFEEVPSPVGGDSMASLLGLDLPPQEAPYLSPLRERQALLGDLWPGSHGLMDGVTSQPDASLPRALIFRDSFANWLWYYLAEHFSVLRMESRSSFDPALIREHEADVVIDQFVERMLEFRAPEPVVEGEELERLAGWVAAGAVLDSERVQNSGSGSVRLSEEMDEEYPLEADLSEMDRREQALLRLELDGEASGVLELRYRSQRRRRDKRELPFEAGQRWLFVPLEEARRVVDPELFLRVESGAVRLLSWELRAY